MNPMTVTISADDFAELYRRANEADLKDGFDAANVSEDFSGAGEEADDIREDLEMMTAERDALRQCLEEVLAVVSDGTRDQADVIVTVYGIVSERLGDVSESADGSEE